MKKTAFLANFAVLALLGLARLFRIAKQAKKTLAVLQGEEIEPGLRLAEVHLDHIVLERNGARETLAWPDKSAK